MKSVIVFAAAIDSLTIKAISITIPARELTWFATRSMSEQAGSLLSGLIGKRRHGTQP
jgi:hypothetical protein